MMFFFGIFNLKMLMIQPMVFHKNYVQGGKTSEVHIEEGGILYEKFQILNFSHPWNSILMSIKRQNISCSRYIFDTFGQTFWKLTNRHNFRKIFWSLHVADSIRHGHGFSCFVLGRKLGDVFYSYLIGQLSSVN